MATLYIRYPSTHISGSVTVDQGAHGSSASAWYMAITDEVGNNVATVKGASESPAPEDKSLVVAISPNSSLSVTNAANGLTGGGVPFYATQVAGNQSGTLTALKLDGTGNLQVSASSLPLPSGAATNATLAETHGTVAAGTAATKSDLAGAVYNSAGITLTNGQQAALQMDSSGNLKISATALPLPTGAATQTTLSSIDTKTPSLGQALMVSSVPVVIASNQSAIPISGTITATNSANGNTGSAVPTQATFIGGSDGTNLRGIKVSATGVVSVDGSATTQPISAASLPLPTGAATSAKQPALGTAGTASADVLTVQGIASMTALKVDGSAVTQPVSGTVTANQGTAAATAGAWPGKVTDGTNVAAVKAASTAAVASDPALVVAISPNNPLTFAPAGRTVQNRARLAYTSTTVTTSAYTQILASTSGAVTLVEIFDSSGQTMLLATGAAGSEVDQIYIFPGGNGQVPLSIGSGVRVSIKAVSASASVGEIDVNFYS